MPPVEPAAPPAFPALPATAPIIANVAVVRLPIVDARRSVTVGYELLFASPERDSGPGANARATAAMLVDAFADIGLERVCGAHPAWLSIARDFLVEAGVPPIRPDRAVLQIVAYPAREDLLAVLRRLSMTGYTLALTEYDGRDDLGELLELCSLVKASAVAPEFPRWVAELQARGVQIVGTDVWDAATLERCRSLGIEYLQGQNAAHASTVHARGSVPLSAAALDRLAEVAAGQLPFEQVERIVASDIGLSVKLLRYINSAFFSLPRRVNSVREALTLLGSRTVQRWATVLSMAGVTGRTDAITGLALQRARMCEMLAGTLAPADRETLFTIGLFSVADQLLGIPMEEVLDTLPFSDDVRDAILRHEGPLGRLLSAVLRYERGDFPELAEIADLPAMGAAYVGAVRWSDGVRGDGDHSVRA